jgi:hypothetical protein
MHQGQPSLEPEQREADGKLASESHEGATPLQSDHCLKRPKSIHRADIAPFVPWGL